MYYVVRIQKDGGGYLYTYPLRSSHPAIESSLSRTFQVIHTFMHDLLLVDFYQFGDIAGFVVAHLRLVFGDGTVIALRLGDGFRSDFYLWAHFFTIAMLEYFV